MVSETDFLDVNFQRFALKLYEVPPLYPEDLPLPEPKSASEWFSKRFPEASRFGPPILEIEESSIHSPTTYTPYALNEDFFAAILGGQRELGHQVVYYEPEQLFYFRDSRDGLFHVTSEAKLKILLSQWLIHCATEMNGRVRADALFIMLRSDAVLKGIISRAKALLAADESFFNASSPNHRAEGPEKIQQIAKLFVSEELEMDSDRAITAKECHEIFDQYLDEVGKPGTPRHLKRKILQAAIEEKYGLRMRNDLRVDDGCKSGWKGLTRSSRPDSELQILDPEESVHP